MGATLLIGDPNRSWREWLKEHRKHSDLLVLDPGDPSNGPPGRLHLFRGDRPIWNRFYGSLDPLRSPHVLIGALAESAKLLEEGALVQCFAYRPNHVLRQTLLMVAQLLKPERILVPEGSELDLEGFPVGPETVDLPVAFPKVVQQAQRKAHWMKMLEHCQPQEVDLRHVSVEGVRLGAGRPLPEEERLKVGLQEAVYAEKIGPTLLIVSSADFEEGQIGRALDQTGCTKAVFADPGNYSNLLCSFARESGEDIGYGILQHLDFQSKIAHCLCTAIPPAPVRILRLGSLRVDPNGNELGDLRPGQI